MLEYSVGELVEVFTTDERFRPILGKIGVVQMVVGTMIRTQFELEEDGQIRTKYWTIPANYLKPVLKPARKEDETLEVLKQIRDSLQRIESHAGDIDQTLDSIEDTLENVERSVESVDDRLFEQWMEDHKKPEAKINVTVHAPAVMETRESVKIEDVRIGDHVWSEFSERFRGVVDINHYKATNKEVRVRLNFEMGEMHREYGGMVTRKA